MIFEYLEYLWLFQPLSTSCYGALQTETPSIYAAGIERMYSGYAKNWANAL